MSGKASLVSAFVFNRKCQRHRDFNAFECAFGIYFTIRRLFEDLLVADFIEKFRLFSFLTPRRVRHMHSFKSCRPDMAGNGHWAKVPENPTKITWSGQKCKLINGLSKNGMKTIEQIPELVRDIYHTVAELQRLFPGRPFTPDGHLMGSLGEVIAAHDYNLRLLPPSTEGYDALTTDGRRVEIKITQVAGVALRNPPDYLIVLKLRGDGTAEEVYNGPGGEPWGQSGKIQKNGQRRISLSKLKTLMKSVSEENKIRKALEPGDSANRP